MKKFEKKIGFNISNKQKFIDAGKRGGSSSKGRKLSETAKQNISKAAKLRKPMSKETKQKISNSLKNRNISKN